jgi:branched-chain amino acid aminotransferase
VPWRKATTHAIGQGLHYGWGAFEGIKFYDTSDGPAIFRLREHITRFLYSTRALRMTEDDRIKCMGQSYSVEELVEITKEAVRRNSLREGYIRPFFYYGGQTIGVKSKDGVIEGIIAVLPSLTTPRRFLKVKISPFVRIDSRSTDVNAKIAGHYVNSFFAMRDAEDEGCDEAILLDREGYVAEASVENVFGIRNKILFTPSLGTILPGITRDTIITLAKDQGFEVQELRFDAEFLKESDEVFLTGTAMEILPVGDIDGVPIGNGGQGEITGQLARVYKDVVLGRVERYMHWLTFVR